MKAVAVILALVLPGCLAESDVTTAEEAPLSENAPAEAGEPLTTTVSFDLELGEYRVDGAVNNFGLKPNCVHVRAESGVEKIDVSMTWTPESPLASELRVFTMDYAGVSTAKTSASPLTFHYETEEPEGELMFGTGTADETALVIAQQMKITLAITHSHVLEGEPYAHSCGVGTT